MRTSMLLLLVVFVGCRTSQPGASAKKPPDWLHGMQQDYVIATGSGTTLEEARNHALQEVRSQIVYSIATFVTSSSSSTVREQKVADWNRFFENYAATTTSTSRYFKSLQGISPVNVSDFYWKQEQTALGLRYIYHIRYPFSQSELDELIAEYNAYLAKLEAELNQIAQTTTYLTVEQLLHHMDRVSFFESLLPAPDNQLATSLKENLALDLNHIQITSHSIAPGKLEYFLQLYGEKITTEKTPFVYASCPLKIEKISAQPPYATAFFSQGKCKSADDLWLEISYDFGDTQIKRRFSFLTW